MSNSTVTDESDGKRCFKTQNFGMGKPEGYCRGTILFQALDRESTTGIFVEGIMAVSHQEFNFAQSEFFKKQNAPTAGYIAFRSFLQISMLCVILTILVQCLTQNVMM